MVNRRVVAGGEASTEAPLPDQQKRAFFRLDVLQAGADGEGTAAQQIHAGTELWTDLARPSSSSSASSVDALTTLAQSTAYCVRLSTKTTPVQPETTVEAVVVTAPPAPVLEPATAEKVDSAEASTGEGSDVVGAVPLKVTWNTRIDTSFLPAGVKPPPISFAVEMAHAREAGPPTHGVGGTATKVAKFVAPGHHAPPAFSFPSGRSAAVEEPTPSTKAARSSGRAQEILVRKDAGFGQCWTLGSSSWGNPNTRAEGFRVVWTGGKEWAEGGTMEALIPPLPPGMRLAFRVRAECRFGVAVSAATVYQTAAVAPMPPKVRWLGKTSSLCMGLFETLWVSRV